MRHKSILMTAVLALYGCMPGGSIKLTYDAPDAPKPAAEAVQVAINVQDKREFVTNRDKNPWYLGHFGPDAESAGDVGNHQRIPLAHQMRNDLLKDLKSLGFENVVGKESRKIAVDVRQWKFSAGKGGTLWYDVHIEVLDGHDVALAQSTVKSEKPIRGSAMEAEVVAIYGEVIRSLIRDNAAILAALKHH